MFQTLMGDPSQDVGCTRSAIDADSAVLRHDAALQHRRMRREIALAVRNNHLALHYQPRVDLASGRIIGAEALARWPNRRGGALSPSRFLPLAERAGLMPQISAWSLGRACRDAAAWPGDSVVSVNIAASQLRDGALPGQVSTALDESGLTPDRLELEIDEQVLAELPQAESETDLLLTLAAIRDLGVRIAVSDFGAGLASLTMLRRLPLCTVKLDRAMLRDVAGSAEEAALVSALTMAAHVIGLSVVALGVETEMQRDVLAGLGCDAAQGFLFGAAMPADRLAALLLADHTPAATPRPAERLRVVEMAE